MSARRCELKLPDLDLPGTPLTASSWLADVGARIVQGDRVVEIVAGEATFDVSAPTSGKLVKRCVGIDQPLQAGQVLAWIEIAE